MEKEGKKVKEVIKEVTEKLDDKIHEVKHTDALVTSRVLFISVLDKIYLIILILMFLGATISNFSGRISSVNYHFFGKVGHEIVIIIVMFITYLIFNWLYKCVAKTMLCLTKNEVYRETYVPFKKTETSIPLNKITAVSTINVFWIFRSLIIHQYGRLPLVFFTWNNQEFKDKLNELITHDKDKVKNEYEDKNIINKEHYKYLMFAGVLLAAIICFIGIIRFFAYTFSPEKKVPGTYGYNDYNIVLDKNGSCDISSIKSGVSSCEWSYNGDNKLVTITYEYTYASSYSRYYSYYNTPSTATDSFSMPYDAKAKTLTYQNAVYKKK